MEISQVLSIVSDISDLQKLRQTLHGKSVGFVPTMGYLHQGHLTLIERSIQENEVTIVSIFVNPTQFNNANDLTHYPRDLNHDIEQLKALNVGYLFLPQAEAIYPDQYEIKIAETNISKELEGEFRGASHFEGMLTIVLKLLNLVQPNKAYFGEKDYQQLLLIKKMVKALFLPIEIIGIQTKRAEDHLALSSRNARLTEEQRIKASLFAELLHNKTLTCDEIKQQLISHGFRIDYIAEKWQRRLGAVWLEDVRLIDNLALE